MTQPLSLQKFLLALLFTGHGILVVKMTYYDLALIFSAAS